MMRVVNQHRDRHRKRTVRYRYGLKRGVDARDKVTDIERNDQLSVMRMI